VVTIRNRPPGERTGFPPKDVVDPGFLKLVRYGIRKAGDPLIEDSLRVIDAILKVMASPPRAPLRPLMRETAASWPTRSASTASQLERCLVSPRRGARAAARSARCRPLGVSLRRSLHRHWDSYGTIVAKAVGATMKVRRCHF
jgi:hypothetical protein